MCNARSAEDNFGVAQKAVNSRRKTGDGTQETKKSDGSIGIRLDQEGVLGSWLVGINEAFKADSRIRTFKGDFCITRIYRDH